MQSLRGVYNFFDSDFSPFALVLSSGKQMAQTNAAHTRSSNGRHEWNREKSEKLKQNK